MAKPSLDSIVARIKPGCVIALHGDLGSGKTTFTRKLLRRLGFVHYVPSPTFSIVQHYETSVCPVAHFDLYRLKDASELEEIGFFDALETSTVIVEWPKIAEQYLPEDTLHLYLAGPFKRPVWKKTGV